MGKQFPRFLKLWANHTFANRSAPWFANWPTSQDHVIATGGGVVLNQNNLRDFSRTGVVICCWVDAKVAHERTKNAKHRPLLGGQADRLARIEALLREREHLYKAIPNRVDTSAMSVEQQTDEILRIYKQQAGL